MHSTSNLEDGYIGSGRRLWLSINKHGKENHVKEILEFLENRQALTDRETQLVNTDLLNDPMCMNLIIGGGSDGNGIGFKNFTSEMRSQHAKKRWENPKYRETLLPKVIETLKNIKNRHIPSFAGHTHTEETIEKLKMHKGKQAGTKNSQFGKMWIVKDSISIKIKKEDFSKYEELGWTAGRKIK